MLSNALSAEPGEPLSFATHCDRDCPGLARTNARDLTMRHIPRRLGAMQLIMIRLDTTDASCDNNVKCCLHTCNWHSKPPKLLESTVCARRFWIFRTFGPRALTLVKLLPQRCGVGKPRVFRRRPGCHVPSARVVFQVAHIDRHRRIDPGASILARTKAAANENCRSSAYKTIKTSSTETVLEQDS